NGATYESINDLSSGDALLSSNGFYTVKRDGEILKIDIPEGFINSFSDEEAVSQFIGIRFPFEVLEVIPEGPAAEIGLQKGDKILAVNNEEVAYFNDLQDALAQFADQKVS